MRVAREVLTGGKMKGGIFKSHLTWLLENKPEEKQRLLDSVTAETRAILTGVILTANWYPFSSLVDLDRNLMNICGNGKPEFLKELGRYSAKINLSTTYRAFNRDTNHDFFRNSALLHSQFQDFGKATYEQTGDRSGRMIHTEYPCYSRIFCDSAFGYYDGCILSHGAASAVVIEKECQTYGDKSCTFEMRWT